jgi:hypothetical protein
VSRRELKTCRQCGAIIAADEECRCSDRGARKGPPALRTPWGRLEHLSRNYRDLADRMKVALADALDSDTSTLPERFAAADGVMRDILAEVLAEAQQRMS